MAVDNALAVNAAVALGWFALEMFAQTWISYRPLPRLRSERLNDRFVIVTARSVPLTRTFQTIAFRIAD